MWAPTEERKVSDYDAMFASNVRTPFFLVAAFAPAMTAKGSGSLINIGSMAGSPGLATGAAYGATKAALVSLTRGWNGRVQRPRRPLQHRRPPAPSTPAPRLATCSTHSPRPLR
ncbi:SDR family NAD(P)-dependent oxidoreductase [Streptomyces sp. NPDC059832]|uniref:SDR family NAD(P)-dependent oxidoreductase n=1 Tax=Streptomyces sp. NPDC059832 TaxID=3346966 RepID=UPI00364F183F